MLETFIESEEDYNAFFRPAIHDSIRQVLKFYGLNSGNQIYFNGENEITPLVGSLATDDVRSTRYTDGVFRNKIFVTAEVEQHAFNSGNSNQRRMETELPTWSDGGELPLILTPSFEGRHINVGVTAYFNSRTLAKQFVNKINRLQANQIAEMNFSATVHLLINPQIIEFFKKVHGLLAQWNPATPELPDWFDAGCKAPITTIANRIGNFARMVQPMKLDNIGIRFNDPETKLARKAEVFGKYEVTLGYSFFFQEFIGWELQYPLMVYQSQIPEEFIPAVQEQHKQPFNKRVAPEVAFAASFAFPDRSIQVPYYVKLPEHDPWKWKFQDWIQPVLQARCTVEDVPTPQIGGNIFDLPGYVWNEKVKAYMLRRREWAFSHTHTPFLVQVYSGDRKVHAPQLSMDETGLITLSRPPEMKNTYRIVVTLDWAIRDYSDAFWDDIRNNRDDWPVVESIFPFYDWDQYPDGWIHHLDEIRADIAKGWGRIGHRINNYMMNLDLVAFNLLEEKK